MKARSSKSQKIGIVTKGLVHGSGQKLVIYREFLLGGEIGAEKCVYDILQGRNAFLNYENKKFKNSINLDFYKGGGRKGLRYCGIALFLVRCCGNFYFKLRYCGFQGPSGVR